jgi:hypothetical protein
MLLFLPIAQVWAQEQHLYQKSTGTEAAILGWILTCGESIELTTTIETEVDVTRFNTGFATSNWTIEDPQTDTRVAVRREGDRLFFSGLFRGEVFEKKRLIDAAPWYQALSYTLRLYSNGSQASQEFWSIRSDTLDVLRMQVRYLGEELIAVEGEKTMTIKLKIQPTGFKAMFWSGYYWLRKSDGVFVRYEGPSGPPGSPKTIVQLNDSLLSKEKDQRN